MSITGVNTGINVPEVPTHLDVRTRGFLTQLRQAVLNIQGNLTPAQPVSNLKCTPVAAGNIVQWTRSDADQYVVLVSPSADIAAAVSYSAGSAQQWFDNIGKGVIKHYYWVQAIKYGAPVGSPQGPVSGTSLAQGTDTVVPAAPPASNIAQRDSTTGRQRAIYEY
jgi:hypothetical protein